MAFVESDDVVERIAAGRRFKSSLPGQQLRSNLGPITAEHRVKPWSETQSQAKRINEIALR